MNIYNFEVEDVKGNQVSLREYEGKVLLIVNTATECGFTPQYEELQKLYDKYRKEEFEILDFPCNQFGNQAPGNNDEIGNFCSMKFGTTFPRFSKIDVNGEQAIPLFSYLQKEKSFAGFHPQHSLTPILEEMLGKQNPDFKNTPEIKWNFTKFLIDRNGNVVERFEPTADISEIEKKVKELLHKQE